MKLLFVAACTSSVLGLSLGVALLVMSLPA